MKQVVLQMGGDAAPRTTEVSLYPNIDDSYSVIPYEGRRLVVRSKQFAGFRQMSTLQSSLQGMAIYGNILVRMANGGTHRIYRLSDTGVPNEVASFSASTGHSNSSQFAPNLESGQAYPYLYVAYLDKKCCVLSITSAFAVSIEQTITVNIAGLADGNIQIGDDGYIWYGCLDDNGHAHFIKFRRVAVSEGNVTLTEADVLNEWMTQESYPYAGYAYVWQGMIIKYGKIWFSYGTNVNGANRGVVIYDTATHAFVTKLDLTGTISAELEDLDFWNDSLLICTYSSELYQMQF